jgi:uncharacterized membrane protein
MFSFEAIAVILGLAYGIFFLLMPFLVLSLLKRVRALEERLRGREEPGSMAAPRSRPSTAPSQKKPQPAGPALEPVPRAETSAQPHRRPPPLPEPPPARAPLAEPQPAPAGWPLGARGPGDGSPWDAATDRIKQWILGGHTLARLGVLILFFGVAFLLKYAVEQGLFPIGLRLASTALGGFLLVGIGWRLRERRHTYGLILQGGGIGIVYLTVFATVVLYQLFSPLLGQALMVVLVAMTAALAVMQNARGLAFLAVVGGFLAPVLISRGGDHVLLFSYYAILNAGILAIAWFKAWRELNLAGFVFTFVIGSVWGAQYYQPQFFPTVEPFLLLFVVFYVAVPILFALRGPPNLRGYLDATLVFGVPLAAAALQSALVRGFEYGLAISALGAGVFYSLLAASLWQRFRESQRLLVEAFLALGVAFATLAIPFAVDGRWTGAAWALEGAALVWVGVRQHRARARISGLLIQGAAGLTVLGTLDAPEGPAPVLNSLYLSGLLIALGGLVSGFHLYRARGRFAAVEVEAAAGLATGWGLLWWLFSGLHEIWAHALAVNRISFALLFAAGSVLALAVLERRLRWEELRYPPMALLLLMALAAVASVALETTHPLRSWGPVAWPAAFAVHYWLLRRYQTAWPRPTQSTGHAGGLWLFVFLGSWELGWQMQRAVPGGPTWTLVAWQLLPALSILAITLRKDRLPWSLDRFRDQYLVLGLGPIAAYLALWVLFATAQPGDPAPLPYVPVLNPLEIMQLTALVSLSIWSGATLPPLHPKVRIYCLAALGFVIVNGVIARSTHFLGDVPYSLSALYDSERFQTATSITWTSLALGLTWTATRKRLRELWFAGVGLLGLVVAKLFVIDLAGVGTVARIISFIVVGLLILVLAYLSPLPPGEERDRQP